MTSIEELQELFDDCHRVAVEKGWWEGYPLILKPYHVLSKLALVHSEPTEALEHVRNVNMLDEATYDGKPVGFPSELADTVVRVADLAGWMRLPLTKHWPLNEFEHPFEAAVASVDAQHCRAQRHWDPDAVGTDTVMLGAAIAQLHRFVSHAYDDVRKEDHGALCGALTELVMLTAALASDLGIDLLAAIKRKHAFNQTRPHRHGGKAL